MNDAVAVALGDEYEEEFSPLSSASFPAQSSSASTPAPSEASMKTTKTSALDRYVDFIVTKEKEHPEVAWLKSLPSQLDMLDPISLLQFKTEVQSILCGYLQRGSGGQGTQNLGPQQDYSQPGPGSYQLQETYPQGATASTYTPQGATASTYTTLH